MDIECQYTPSKKIKKIQAQYSTPDKKKTAKNNQTPKRCNKAKFQTPQKNINYQYFVGTPIKKNQNPQSRKAHKSFKQNQESPFTPYKSPAQQRLSSDKKISQFFLSRLQTDYTFVKYLGSGNFSKVGLYKSRLTQQQFAIKITQLSLMSINQVQALGSLSIFADKKKNIIRYYHSWIQNQSIYIVMQYCPGTLTKFYGQHISENKIIPEQNLKQFLKQCLKGLKCMHQHNMVHLDIKPDNLLLKNQEIKISDLGLCRVTRIKKWSQLEEGDSRYLAKQVLNYHQGIDLKKADIYSLGMSFFQGAILQQLPNNGQEWVKMRDQGINLNQIIKLSNYSKQFKSIIQKMTDSNWQNRPSCQDLLNNQYFNEQKSKRFSRFLNKIGGNLRKKQSSL